MSSESEKLKPAESLEAIYHSISEVLQAARETAFRAVDSAMVQAYWQIGRIIVEEEQQGKARADYGTALIPALAKRLTAEFGKGFAENNLWYMRQFYQRFPNLHVVRGELRWTHYRLLLKPDNFIRNHFCPVPVGTACRSCPTAPGPIPLASAGITTESRPETSRRQQAAGKTHRGRHLRLYGLRPP